ncbi:MAG: hypothetical protein IJX78_03955 [Bacilli bacterium]|nr:hypothetical protein [Bacilli bacterium]
MNKKVIIVTIILLLGIGLCSCGTYSISDARKEAVEVLKYTPKDMNIVGKFGEGFVVDITDYLWEGGELEIDGYVIPYSGFGSEVLYIVDGKSLSLASAYYFGYLASEDLYTIRERYLENDRDIDVDYPLIDPYPNLKRCIHKPGNWKITKEATCKDDGEKILECKKCEKVLKTVSLVNLPHDYIDGKCMMCEEKEYVYVDSYEDAPVDMTGFYGTYIVDGKNERTISVFGVKNEEYNEKDYSWYTFSWWREENKNIKKDLDLLYLMSNDTVIKVQYKTTHPNIGNIISTTDLLSAYLEGIINKNIFIEVRNKIAEENKVGNYIYEHYEDMKWYATNYKESYLDFVNYIQNKDKSNEIFLDVVKHFNKTTSPSFNFYNKYNDYYVGVACNELEYPEKETIVRVVGKKFELGSHCKLVVFNEEKIYDLKTAYYKGILSEEDIKEIYEFHQFEIND